MQKQKVAVIFGGASSEHEVSLRSAASVIRNIPADLFDVITLGITKEGKWYQYFGDVSRIEDGSWLQDVGNAIPAFISPDRRVGIVRVAGDGDENYETERVDVVFPVLHGKNGEDGTVQGLLEIADIPYVGCSVLASAMCMDKAVTNTMLDHNGIKHAPWEMLMAYERGQIPQRVDAWEARLGYPIFVKPANAGSSVGITKAHNRDELLAALDLAFQHDCKAILEKTIVGQELECSVLGNDAPVASVVGEILPANEFYDYEAKYQSAQSKTRIPAAITAAQQAEIQRTAVRAFLLLGCSGMARVDFLMDSRTGDIYLNEINTIPGFTSISMYAKMLEASGVSYPALIQKLLALAIERHAQS